MNIYPHSSPIILTDTMFTQYGGQIGDTTKDQRQNAYVIAEQRATSYIGSFLLPTTITGTHPYNLSQFIATDYGYVHQVYSASVLSLNNLQTCTLQSDSGCVFIFNDTYGYLDFSCINTICGCNSWKWPYQFQIAYQAGLPTGTANQPAMEHALSIVAELALNEMKYPRMNEAVGDRGIEEFRSLDYSEKRKKLKRTALGQSARANYAAELIKSTVSLARRAIRMR